MNYLLLKSSDTSNKKHYKVRDHCHYTGKYRDAAHNICNLRYKIANKKLVKEFDGNFKCLGENTEKYIIFSAPIKKNIESKNTEITYKIKFIDSYSLWQCLY